MATRGQGLSRSYGHRTFQGTNFGCDRDKKTLPPWKQRMMNRLLKSGKQNRDKLFQKLKENRSKNSNISPKSKKTQANQTIDSFKRAIIDNDKNDPDWARMTQEDEIDIADMLERELLDSVRKKAALFVDEEQDKIIHDEDTAFMLELALEQMCLEPNKNNNGKNQNKNKNENSENAKNSKEHNGNQTPNISNNNTNSNDENKNDSINNHCSTFGTVCPVCNNDIVEIEEGESESKENNSLMIKVYVCPNWECDARWISSEKSIQYPMKINNNNNTNNNNNSNNSNNNSNFDIITQCNPNSDNDSRYETDKEHGARMFAWLQDTLNKVFLTHHSENQCNRKPNVTVEPDTKYLQVWCNHCKFNTLL